MHTHAAGRRSSTPAPASRASAGAVRSFGSADRQPAPPPDYDTWLHNAESFGHHFAALPAPVSPQPVQRRPDESASPYALPAGVPLNALRASSGPEPIQGLGIPEWLKRAGRGIGGAVGGVARGIGGLARGAWNLVKSPFRRGGGNRPAPPVEDRRPLLAPPAVHEPEPEAPADPVPALLPAPAPLPAVDAHAHADADADDGIGLGPLPAPSSAGPAPSSEIVPPSFEELQRQRARWEAQARRGPRSAAAAAAEDESSSSEDEGIDEDAVRAVASANSDRLSGHGRKAHGRKGRSRPASQVASNTARSRRRAAERTVAAAASRAKKEKEKES